MASGPSSSVPASEEEQLVANLPEGPSEWIMVDVGTLAVSTSTEEVLSTSAPVGSCVAVCLWEADAKVSGLLHFLLPDSKT